MVRGQWILCSEFAVDTVSILSQCAEFFHLFCRFKLYMDRVVLQHDMQRLDAGHFPP